MSNLTLCIGDVLEEISFEKKGVGFSTRRHLNELLVCALSNLTLVGIGDILEEVGHQVGLLFLPPDHGGSCQVVGG